MNDNRFELVNALQDPDRHDHRQTARQRLKEYVPPPELLDFKSSPQYFYLDKKLEIAINMALAVGAPLLLTGEPGTGKTQVAHYLRWYFNIKLYEYQVRSTSTADDMKYDFDAVAYLRTATQNRSAEEKTPQRQDFLRKKILWQAYEDPEPSVLPIDEIDKAPRDFPNDLLLELGNKRFSHPFEDGDIIYKAKRPPIVVITSNAERRLPDAFLRRCIYHHIELTEDLVKAALNAWNRNPDFPDTRAIQEVALKKFMELRAQEAIQKRPATAEFLVWLAILSAQGVTAEKLRDCELKDLPAKEALIKDSEDLNRLNEYSR